MNRNELIEDIMLRFCEKQVELECRMSSPYFDARDDKTQYLEGQMDALQYVIDVLKDYINLN